MCLYRKAISKAKVNKTKEKQMTSTFEYLWQAFDSIVKDNKESKAKKIGKQSITSETQRKIKYRNKLLSSFKGKTNISVNNLAQSLAELNI